MIVGFSKPHLVRLSTLQKKNVFHYVFQLQTPRIVQRKQFFDHSSQRHFRRSTNEWVQACDITSEKPPIDSLCSEVNVAIPLCERAPDYEYELSKVMEWFREAKERTSRIGNSFADLDGGPTAAELMKELSWMMEDAVAQVKLQNNQWHDATWNRVQILSHAKQNDNQSTLVRLRDSLEDELNPKWQLRLEQRLPFQYIVAAAHWREFVLTVQPGILIPRPETEQMIELAAMAMNDFPELRESTWLDMGTGSGALAVGLGDHLSEYGGEVLAVDKSHLAVAVARSNVHRYNLQDIVKVKRGSWYLPVMKMKGKVGGILSNPPYIPSQKLPELQAEVGQHEPIVALDGGPGSGTNSLMEVISGAEEFLMPGGFLCLETDGGKQVIDIAGFLSSTKVFRDVEIVKDIFGLDRFVTAYRAGNK